MASEPDSRVLVDRVLTEKKVPNHKEGPAERLVELQAAVAKKAPGNLTLSGGRKGMVVSRRGGFGPVVDGTYLPNHPFDPTAPAISRDKPLMVGTNKDEMAFFFFERKAIDIFSLTEDALKSRLDKELGSDAEKLPSTHCKGQPGDSPSEFYIA